jgi:hypothetical protein
MMPQNELRILVRYTLEPLLLRFQDLTVPGVEYVGSIDNDFTDIDLTQFDSKIIRGNVVYYLHYTLKVIFGAQEGILKFEATSKGKAIGKSSITFAKASYY